MKKFFLAFLLFTGNLAWADPSPQFQQSLYAVGSPQTLSGTVTTAFGAAIPGVAAYTINLSGYNGFSLCVRNLTGAIGQVSVDWSLDNVTFFNSTAYSNGCYYFPAIGQYARLSVGGSPNTQINAKYVLTTGANLGSVTIGSGTVTANQGTAGATPWPMLVSNSASAPAQIAGPVGVTSVPAITLSSGTLYLGAVNVSNSASAPAQIAGPVGVTSIPAVTLAAGTAYLGAVNVSNTAASPVQVAGPVGVTSIPAVTLASGTLYLGAVNVSNSASAPVNIAGPVGVTSLPSISLATGANVIGAVTQSGGPWTTNITQINGTTLNLSNTTVANSLPVTMADQKGSANLTASGQSLQMFTNSVSTVTMQTTGTWSATVAYFVSTDGVTWSAIRGRALTDFSYTATQDTVNRNLEFQVGGYRMFSVSCTAFTSGTIVVTCNGGGPNIHTVGLTIAGTDVSGGNPVPVSLGGISTLTPNGGTYDNARTALSVASAGSLWDSKNTNNVFWAKALGTLAAGNVSTEGTRATYSVSITNVAAAGSATDVFTITGVSNKTVHINRIFVSGIATAASAAMVTVVKRSTANSGGTSVSPFAIVPLDSASGAAGASVVAYTANPTLGTLVGTVDCVRATFTTTAGAIPNVPTVFNYGTTNNQSLILRGTSQQVSVNLSGQSITGLTLDLKIEWTEDTDS